MRPHNCQLHLVDVGQFYSNLQISTLQQPKIASRLSLFILPVVLFPLQTEFPHIFLLTNQLQIIFHLSSILPWPVPFKVFET